MGISEPTDVELSQQPVMVETSTLQDAAKEDAGLSASCVLELEGLRRDGMTELDRDMERFRTSRRQAEIVARLAEIEKVRQGALKQRAERAELLGKLKEDQRRA